MFNQSRLKELEMANKQWEQWYQNQQQAQFQPQFQTMVTTEKKKKKNKQLAKNDIKAKPLSFEQKLWIAIIILSFFSVLIIKDWLTDIKTPERVEQRKLKTK